jgi:hypothetical protein
MAGRARLWILAVLAAAGLLAASGFTGQVSSVAAKKPGSWGTAETLGGVAKKGDSSISAISCTGPGNCGAVGFYDSDQVFVIRELHGIWGKPTALRGLARTSKPSSSAAGIACYIVGNCIIAGTYTDASGHQQAYYLNEVHGTWGKVTWIPGLGELDQGLDSSVTNLECPSAGNCTLFGSYADAQGASHPFFVIQIGGLWDDANPVPMPTGLPGQAPGTTGTFGTASCSSERNCSVAGSYPVSAPSQAGQGNQVFVENEVDGNWRAPVVVAAALNAGLDDSVSVMSCASRGNCTAAGTYTEPEGNVNSFVVDETNHVWGQATAVTSSIPGFDGPDGDWITAITCPSAGNCVAGGIDNVEHDALSSAVFIVTEVNGTWGQAIPVPGTPKLNQGDQAGLNQISCSSPGNCGVAGYLSVAYGYGFVYTQPFVATEVNGKWSNAIEVPGIKPLPPKDGQSAGTTAISCIEPDRCSAGGYRDYASTGLGAYAFVDSQRT